MSTIYMPAERQANLMRVAFSGKMRSGKGEAMEYLNNKYFGESIHIMNFADPLYELCELIQTYCNFPVEKDRELLQFIGTDYGRKHNPNVWVMRLFSELERHHKFDSVFIGDVRLHNEATGCKAINIPVIRINATEETRLSRGADPDRLNHVSETALDDYSEFDYVIDNDGTKAEFHSHLDFVFGEILTKLTAEAKPTMLCPTGSPVTITPAEQVGMGGVRITASGLYLP